MTTTWVVAIGSGTFEIPILDDTKVALGVFGEDSTVIAYRGNLPETPINWSRLRAEKEKT